MYQPNKGSVLNVGKPTLLVTLGRKLFQLEDWWVYQDHSNTNWVVPKGFIYDLASIPSWLWWLQWGPWNNGAVLHDFAYCFGYAFAIDNNQLVKKEISKSEADDLFADIIYTTAVENQLPNAPLWRIRLMHMAVSWFGRGYWSKSEEDKAECVYGKPLEALAAEYAAHGSSVLE